MRWDDLFLDLEAQLAAAETADLAADADQRLRLEIGRTTVVGRLRAAVGHDIALSVGGQAIHGRIEGVGPDWLLLGGPPETLLPLATVGWFQGGPGVGCRRPGTRLVAVGPAVGAAGPGP